MNKRELHGGRANRDRLYSIWTAMRKRCRDKNYIGRAQYFDRGISVCPEWNYSYPEFRDWALSHGYSSDLTIDRIDNGGNYCPENCQWITNAEQQKNRRDNRILEFNGRKQIMADWAREVGMNLSTLKDRLKRGWSVPDALTKPLMQTYMRRSSIGMENENG